MIIRQINQRMISGQGRREISNSKVEEEQEETKLSDTYYLVVSDFPLPCRVKWDMTLRRHLKPNMQ